MSKKNEELFDSRVVKQNIKRGLITIDEYREYLDSLEDLSSETTKSGFESTKTNSAKHLHFDIEKVVFDSNVRFFI